MKGLSIEEKAKLYDEAIKKVNDYYEGKAKLYSDVDKTLDYLFPELKESEDEKIRKELLAVINDLVLPDEQQSRFVAWLEKQGEHANFRSKIQIGDKVTRNDSGVLVNLSQFKRVAKETEKQGKQKPYPATLEKAIELYYFTYGNGNGGFDNLSLEKFKDIVKTFVEDYGEQKSVEWSEEDEEISAAIIKRIKGESDALSVSLSSAIGWIGKVKDRVIPQPKEWSEEDEKKRTLLISILEVNHPNGHFKVNPANTLNMEAMSTEELVSWLKSLRPQNWTKEDKERYISCLQRLGTGNPEQPETINSKWFKEHVYPQSTWKPSEEMLEALYRVIPNNVMEKSEDEMLLDKLYQGLKYGKVLSEN